MLFLHVVSVVSILTYRRCDDSDFGDIGKTVRGGEKDAVVHDRDARLLRAVDAPQDLAPRQHASAAVDDKVRATSGVRPRR